MVKLKSIGIGSRVLSICREFLSNSRQRGVFDRASSEWVPIVSGVPQGSVLGLILIFLYPSEIFEREQTIMSMKMTPHYWPIDLLLQPPRDLPMIQEWCNHWCIILNPTKLKALVVSRSKTVNPHHCDSV